ncbi:MAG: glycosyltransferase family protein, partial [Bacteroidota bacterium]
KALDKNIFTPIIRKQVRELKVKNKNYYTVYLPSYSDERIIKFLKQYKNEEWKVFSKFSRKKYSEKNISIQPLDTNSFLESMASCKGVLCNAGFGTTSEALFLNKKLLVVPMKTQYEQHCNAAMLKSMDVPVMKKLKNKYADKVTDWLKNDKAVEVNYPDITENILDTIIANHAGKTVDDAIEHLHYSLFQ